MSSKARSTTQLLKALRQLMSDTKYVVQPVHAYIVPSGDAHLNEYISPCDCRREFISGFSGSAGTAVITQSQAALWVDGRYHVQAAVQVDDNWTIMKEGIKGTPSIPEWLSKALEEPETRVAVDPSVLRHSSWVNMEKELSAHGLSLIGDSRNLIDEIWEDQPARPNNPLMVLGLNFTGKTWNSKVTNIREKLTEKSVSACVFTALDDIAWLLNLRGSDIPLNPVFYSYAIVSMTETRFFVDEGKVTSDVKQHLGEGSEEFVNIHPYSEFFSFLSSFVSSCSGKIWLSKASSQKIHSEVPENKKYVTENSAVAIMKAVKNDVEIEGMRNAHYKDAVTLCEFFSWLEKEVVHNNLTETEAATKLEQIKREQEDYISLSFDTISSSGPNAAICHYKAVAGEDRVIDNTSIYLLDSGAQYRDGTTDVTRTFHFGTPTAYQRECYTRVLKGHIQLATAIWPKGTKGCSLDCLARMHLWSAGLEYKHGTGHGVGSFLNVHEGPCAISPAHRLGEVALESGMIVTDEPGYYEDGKFGIRIENCMLIKEAQPSYNFKDIGFLQMEPITLVPISTKMIDPSLLTDKEVEWLNSYHNRCRDIISPLLQSAGKQQALDWLLKETEPLG